MKVRQGTILAAAIGLLAFLAPILISLRLAWIQGISDEQAEGIRFAADSVRRGEETASQIERAMRILRDDHLKPCSPDEVNLMRQIDIGSSNLQTVGRISGNLVLCSSLGITTPIDVGQPTFTSSFGIREWLDYNYGPQRLDRLDIIDFNGIAILVDPKLLVDLDTGGQGVELAVTVPSTSSPMHLITSTASFKPQWLQPIAPGLSSSYIDGAFVVSQVRSSKHDLAAVSILPIALAYHHVKEFAAIFVPIGCVCGIILALAVAYVGRQRLSPEGLLKTAARNQDFYLEYQPVIELRTGRIVGAEALVRWKRGDTVISPASFIPLAEEIGIIALITRNVLNIVTRDLPRLLAVDPGFHVAVNLTATDLKAAAIVDRLTDVLQTSGASPGNLVVEATEHGLVNGPECFQVISQLHARGFRIAIDDFGTGYSNLSSLQELHLDLLKIDKGFIDTIQADGTSSELVPHIIDIARSLRIQIVAEGVETEAQTRFLTSRGVEYAQGWFFSHAVRIDDLCTLLDTQPLLTPPSTVLV
ncbi:MAG: EAL domain-containing protein [Acidobacteriota bacterium]